MKTKKDLCKECNEPMTVRKDKATGLRLIYCKPCIQKQVVENEKVNSSV